MNDSLFSLDCCSSVVIERNDYGWRVWNRHSWKQRTAIVEAKRTERKEKECLESMLLLDHPLSRLDERKWSHQQRWIRFPFPSSPGSFSTSDEHTRSTWHVVFFSLTRLGCLTFVPVALIAANLVAWLAMILQSTSFITDDTWASSHACAVLNFIRRRRCSEVTWNCSAPSACWLPRPLLWLFPCSICWSFSLRRVDISPSRPCWPAIPFSPLSLTAQLISLSPWPPWKVIWQRRLVIELARRFIPSACHRPSSSIRDVHCCIIPTSWNLFNASLVSFSTIIAGYTSDGFSFFWSVSNGFSVCSVPFFLWAPASNCATILRWICVSSRFVPVLGRCITRSSVIWSHWFWWESSIIDWFDTFLLPEVEWVRA